MKINALELIDFYKSGHYRQYPKGTELVYSNFTPRSDRLFAHKSDMWDHKVVFVGLQGTIQWLLIDLWNETFFNRPKDEVVGEYIDLMNECLGVGAVTKDHIEALHDLGYLPIRIKAIKEGSRVDVGVPVFTVVNTKPEFYWVTNYLEDMLSAESWKTINNATTAYEYRRLLDKYAEITGSPKEFVPWQGHDFSFRGLSGCYDAAHSGIGHLFPFFGTDTIPAIRHIKNYYGGKNTFVGGSVAATEHSVMCASGKEDELETFRRLIEDVYPSGIVSIVSDTWNFWNVVGTNNSIAVQLKDKILNRQPDALGNAKVVFRPDSGDPVEVVCGIQIRETASAEWAADILLDSVSQNTDHGECGVEEETGIFKINNEYRKITIRIDWNRYDKQYYYIDGSRIIENVQIDLTDQQKGAIECLWDTFGGTINEKGYKVLNPRVGLIYGDSITLERATQILKRLEEKGFASCNIVFGIGSYTYNYSTRDSLGFAMKATFAKVNGIESAIFKDPITDSGTKKSAKGLLRVENKDGKFVLLDNQTWEGESGGELETVFEDGKLVRFQSIDEIRKILLG